MKEIIKNLSGPLVLLLSCRMITAVASYLIVPFLLLYLTKERSFSIPLATAAMMLLALVPGMIGPIVGTIQDRFTSKSMLLTACLFSVAGTLILVSRTAHPAWAFLAVSLMAVGGSISSVSFNTAVPRLLPVAQLTLAFSLMHSTANLGFFIGPALAGLMLLRGMGPREVLWLSVSCYVFAFIYIATLLPQDVVEPETPKRPSDESTSPRPALALLNLAYLLLFFIDWADYAQTNSFMAQFASDALNQPAIAGFFFSSQAIPVIIFVPLAGRAMQGWSLDKLFKTYIIGVAAFPLGFLACHYIGRLNPYSGLTALALFMVFQEMLTIPSGGALAARLVSDKKYGVIFGWRSSALALGRAFGTSVGGYFYLNASASGFPAKFWANVGFFFIALWALAAMFALYALKHKPAAMRARSAVA